MRSQNCSKNSASGRIFVQNFFYEGNSVTRSQKSYCRAPTCIFPGSECLAGICGYWRNRLKPAVSTLGIHFSGQKIILIFGRAYTLEKFDVPSSLERWFGVPRDSCFDLVTDPESRYRHFVDDHPTSRTANSDVCEAAQFTNPGKNPVLCLVNAIQPRNHELSTLPRLLRPLAATTWEQLRTHDGGIAQTFYEAARQHR
jgi:hypothetical protein